MYRTEKNVVPNPAQYWLCCSARCSVPTMLLQSKQNTDYSAQLYAQYWLLFSTLSIILTMLLHSKHNTDYAAQLCAQYRLICSTLSTIQTIFSILWHEFLKKMVQRRKIGKSASFFHEMWRSGGEKNAGLGILPFQKNVPIFAFFSVLYKRTERSLRSFLFFIKERNNLCVLFRSL